MTQLIVAAAVSLGAPSFAGTDTTFTYQGVLLSGGSPVRGTADLRFRLYDAAAGGNQIGSIVSRTNVDIDSGGFAVELDFGAAALAGGARWLEIDVRAPAGAGGYVTLAPRQAITSAPWSVQTRGLLVDEAHDVGLGTSDPRTRLDVVAAAEAGTAETVARLGVDDAPADFLSVRDATDVDGRFAPMVWAHHETDDREALDIVASTTPARDVGTRAVLTFDAWRSDGAVLTGPVLNRPPFGWANGGTALMTLDASGRLGIGTTSPTASLHLRSSAPGILVRDSNDSGAAQEGWLSFRDGNGSETGWFGFGSSSSSDLTIRNSIGDIVVGSGDPVTIWGPLMIERSGDEASLLRFAMDRTWEFRQEGTGSTAALKLQSVGFAGDRDFVLSGDYSHGTWMRLRNELGDTRVSFGYATCPNAPCAGLGVGGVALSTSPGAESYEPHTGRISVGIELAPAAMWIPSSQTGQIDVQVMVANEKNFRMPSPREDDMDIVFTCVEGPEAAVYVRGTARLEHGHAVVELPRHFADVAVTAGITVELTPGSAASKGLAAVARSVERFEVRELFDGRGSYAFDWKVTAVRRGFEDFEVIRPRGHP